MISSPNHSDALRQAFEPLFGLPAWQVRRGHGSFLTLEFGAPYLRIREPIAPTSTVDEKVATLLKRRKITPRGAWHLWIYCCHWRVLVSGKEIANSDAVDSEIAAAAEEIDGQILTPATADPAFGRSVFEFDHGAVALQTWPYGAGGDTQWMLYMHSGEVFSYRDDGSYNLGPASQALEEQVWASLRPIPTA
jgi:hypothetical protein